jgi:hypothetical protein
MHYGFQPTQSRAASRRGLSGDEAEVQRISPKAQKAKGAAVDQLHNLWTNLPN